VARAKRRVSSALEHRKAVKTWAAGHWSDGLLEAGLLAVVVMMAAAFWIGGTGEIVLKDMVFAFGGCALVGWLVVGGLLGLRRRWLRSALDWPLIAMGAALLVSLVMSRYRYAGVSELGKWAGYGGFYALALHVVRSPAAGRRMAAAIAAGAFLVCLYGTIQRLGWDPIVWQTATKGRVFSSFANPTYLASYILLILPVLLNMALLTEGRKDIAASARAQAASRQKATARTPWRGIRLARWAYGGIAAWAAACLWWSGTRAAWVTALAALILNGLLLLYCRGLRGRKMGITLAAMLLGAMVVAGAGLAVMPAGQRYRVLRAVQFLRFQKEGPEARRVLPWRAAVEIFREHPLFGGGLGTYRILSRGRYPLLTYRDEIVEQSGARHAHNIFLEALAESGAVGCAALLWLLGAYFWIGWQAIRSARSAWAGHLAAGCVAGVTAFLLQNMVAVTFYWAGVAFFFWLLVGLAAAVGGLEGATAVKERWYDFRRIPVCIRGAAAATVTAVLVGVCVTMALMWRSDQEFSRVEKLIDAGRQSEAQLLLQKAVELNPWAMQAFYKLGYVYGQTGRFERALEAYKRAEALSPGFERIQYNLGISYLLMKHPRAAVRHLERQAKVDRSGMVLGALARAYAEAGQREKAIAVATETVEEDPRSASLRREMAKIYLLLRHPDEAEENLRAARELDPGNPLDDRLLEKIRTQETKRQSTWHR
jgi:Flp pilus assembly protein TadD/O-antigen ligase